MPTSSLTPTASGADLILRNADGAPRREGWSERCADLLRSYAPAAAAHIGTSYVLPTEEQWDDPAYRVVCFATDLMARTGSIRSWQGTAAPSPGVAA
ncbi:hypothetical protein ACFQY4_27990 [Catellatospora bangladeshensis]|uniref:Septum formation-related domain-containing protein n=1 Tax=Catellatospora bangladeshensis TaxID=310355 RepID=A0A8J3JR93_9ACTN|nr:hypothetical protein Cba03nite_68260 [Catellatospora bangladeshensis]